MRVSRISWASRSVTTPASTADANMAAADSSTAGCSGSRIGVVAGVEAPRPLVG